MAIKTFFTNTRGKKEAANRYSGGKAKDGKEERAKTGFEMECHLIDNEGRISNDADRVLEYIRKGGLSLEADRECCHSFIEMREYPRIYVRNVASKFLENMLGTLEAADKLGLSFYPLAVYPCKYEPKMREDGWYGAKGKIFGDRWNYAGRCAGFHFHYSLPSGIFRYEEGRFETNARRSEKQKTINAYNFSTAADPALTCYTQSSPVYQGRFLAKDTRLLLYRGGSALGYDGLYSNYPLFGSLQPYVITYEELVERTETRFDRWIDIAEKAGGDVSEVQKKSRLDIAWNPIKINKVGSLELRNMDMNLPSTLMAVGILAKYVLRDIQRKEFEVIANNSAIEKPFEFEEEGDSGRIFVPPFWYLKTILQREAAWRGFESDRVYTYCMNFFSLCLRFANKKYYPILKPIKEMLKRRESRSDEVLRVISRMGYGREEEIPDEALREVVLFYSKTLRADIIKTKVLMESLVEGAR